MSDIAERARTALTPLVEAAGYEVVDVDWSKSYGENNLTVFIFKKGGVTLEDCEKVNDAVDAFLDENDLTDGQAYNFNVSSPGLDRPVRTPDDFRRSLDTELEILFIKPIGKKKKANGVLVAYDDATVTLKNKDKEIVYDRQNVEIIRPYIKF
ncbi:MAG: ribosome maturation factor RimP [Clostridia bacterium]|nr:ribosome maturation factor RimP [Clostridia bacterium]